MRYKRIALVNPPLNQNVVKCIDDGFWQPLNLLTLASYLMKMGYKGEIRIFDQAIMSEEEMFRQLNLFAADLVGISPNIDSYERALEIAEHAKKSGADIVFGGAYATKLAENILRNRDSVDFIIVNEGERALWNLAKGAHIETMPNLVYRMSDGRISTNDIELCNQASFCEIDYSLVDMDEYFQNYSRSLHPGEYKRPATILTQRGCVWRERTEGCIFCSRINHNAVFDKAADVWKRIEKLKSDYDIDCVIDVGDDFLGSKDWFYNFYESRPVSLKKLGVRFIYSRVEHINDETADMLKELNVSEICLGLESGDREILKRVRKGNTPEQHIRAVKLLAERDIKLISAFMLGHPGESKTSLDMTMQHIIEILEHNNTNELVVSIFTPLSGSLAYNMLLESSNEFSIINKGNDKFHVRTFQEEWVKNFCSVDFGVLLEYAEKLNNLFRDTYIEFA